MNRRKFYLTTAALTTTALLSLTACSGPAAELAGDGAPPADAAAENTSITVAMTNPSCILRFPAYVAVEQGFFAENGLDVEVRGLNGSSAVLQAMLANQAQMGTPGTVPTLQAHIRGEDVVYVANTTPGGSFVLVSPQDKGFTDASDLDGKTIGVATADGGEVSFLKSIMTAAGLEDGAYEILVVGEGGQAVAGFQRNDVDAYAASMDGMATIEFAGIPLDDLTGTATKHLFGNGLAVSRSFMDANPEAVQAFGKAYNQGMEYGLANFDKVVEACGKYQPQEVEDPAYAEALFKATVKSITSPDGEVFGLFNPEYWDIAVQDLVAAGEISEGDIDVTEVYTNEFVEGYGNP